MSESNDSENTQSSDDVWAEALKEQAELEPAGDTAHDTAGPAAEAESTEDDATPDSVSETQAMETVAEAASKPAARKDNQAVFETLEGGSPNGAARDLDMIMEIPVTLSVELGQTRVTIKELLDMAKGSIIELDGLAGEPMDILINGYLIAQGEVVVVEEKYGIRITEIVDRAERIHKLNR